MPACGEPSRGTHPPGTFNMQDSAFSERHRSRMVDQSRRDIIKMIAKGTLYMSPAIVTLAAPTRLMGQGPSGMMSMFCDSFPTLCMVFSSEAAPPPGSQPPPSGSAPAGQPAPWDAPAPGGDPWKR